MQDNQAYDESWHRMLCNSRAQIGVACSLQQDLLASGLHAMCTHMPPGLSACWYSLLCVLPHLAGTVDAVFEALLQRMQLLLQAVHLLFILQPLLQECRRLCLHVQIGVEHDTAMQEDSKV